MGHGLLWFFLGAGAATMYAKRHHEHQHEGYYYSTHRCHGFSRAPGGPTNSSNDQAPPQPPTNSDNLSSPEKEPFFPATPWSSKSPATTSDPWAADKERMKEIGNQVGVNVLEFSESTLDTLLSGIHDMKSKLVQQRLERERLEAEKIRTVEEQKTNPPRYV